MLTTKKASEMLQVSEETVRRWIRSGELEAFRIGKTYKIDQASLKELIDRKSKEPGNNIFKMAQLLDEIGTGSTDSETISEKLIGNGAAVIEKSVSIWMDLDQILDFPEAMTLSQIQNFISKREIEKNILINDYQEEMKILEAKYKRKLLEKDKEIAELEIIKEQKFKELRNGQ